MPPKERITYGLILSVFVFGAGYVGAQRLRRPPNVEIRIPNDIKLPLPQSPLTEQPASGQPLVGQSATTQMEIVVDVVGAVKSPGVHHLPPGARIDDAIKAAGGPTAQADLEVLNRAAKLQDGEQLIVPKKGAPPRHIAMAPPPESPLSSPYIVPSEAAPDLPAPAGKIVQAEKTEKKSSSSKGGKHPDHVIDLQTATPEELQELPGVGPATCDKLIAYRQEHGHLTFDDLRAIRGLGPKRLEKIRPWVR